MDITGAELDFFLDQPGRLAIYLSVREQVLALSPDIVVKVHKTAISFRAPRPFLYVGPPFRKNNPGWPADCLLLSFSSETPARHPSVIAVAPIRANLYTNHALTALPVTLDGALLDLVRRSLNLRNHTM